MNAIIDNFEQILDFAKKYGLPIGKKRAILREYLQVKILNYIYEVKTSLLLYFIGGTSLRLVRGLDRFSEDLDFDASDVSLFQIEALMKNIDERLRKENIDVYLYKNVTKKRAYFELRFPNLLFQLRLSQNIQENLSIKFDFEQFWKGYKREIVLLSRFGFLTNIITIPLGEILLQKLYAYLHRKQTLPRDIYDVIWLVTQEVKIDSSFAKRNNMSKEDLIDNALNKFGKEKSNLKGWQTKILPFLINENYATRLALFPKILEKLR